VQVPRRLLVILRLLIVIGGILIIIVVRSTSGTDAKSSQLSRSQRGIRVRDGWEDWHVRELKERLIMLTVVDLLVVPHNLMVLLHHIHVLIHAPAHSKYASEHLQDTSSGAGGCNIPATPGLAIVTSDSYLGS
jgi:hypothetical protein